MTVSSSSFLTQSRGRNSKMKSAVKVLSILCLGAVIGVTVNYYGLVFENLRVTVVVSPGALVDQDQGQGRPAIDDAVASLLRSAASDIDSNGSSIIGERQADYVVPSVAHYIWFGKDLTFTFINYVSVRSMHVTQRPAAILFHCDYEPIGDWWTKIRAEVPSTIVHRLPPQDVFGQRLLHAYHRSDVARLDILIAYGGIYVDLDVFVVSSLDPLRVYDVTLGKEHPPKFISGIIVARQDALFLRLWRESYRNNYWPFDWDYNSARITYQLYLQQPELVHVELERLTTPDWTERHLLWNDVIDWRHLYVVHVMQHMTFRDYTPDDVRTANSTFGEIMRYFYYGSSKLLAT